MRALAVDDSYLVRKVVTRFLTEIGYQVDTATNGEEALVHLLKHGGPDLIVLDWNMPGMDGYEFLTRMRKLDRFQDIKVIMLSARNEMESVIKAVSAGANEYLMKPFSPEALVEKIRLLGLDIPKDPAAAPMMQSDDNGGA